MEYLIGSIVLFPYSFIPADWLPCDGRSLSIPQYQTLFALIGNRYGGDGRTSFSLPDLRGAVPNANLQYFIAVNGIFPERN